MTVAKLFQMNCYSAPVKLRNKHVQLYYMCTNLVYLNCEASVIFLHCFLYSLYHCFEVLCRVCVYIPSKTANNPRYSFYTASLSMAAASTVESSNTCSIQSLVQVYTYISL